MTWRINNNSNIFGIHYFSHKGQTRITWKFVNEVGAGNEVKKVRVKRREKREKQWERNRSQEEELKGMEAK